MKTFTSIILSGLMFCLVPLTALAEEVALNNPLGDTATGTDLVVKIITGFLGIMSLFALVMVIYGGFQYIYSAGNPEQLKKAKDTIVWALLGMVIAFLSLAVINFVVGAFK
ncbi:MAG: hypothetical protein PHH01_02850 [Patescibacteria group bacterium]|nr:hypothetical protein [Patescibacteria group bacterium]